MPVKRVEVQEINVEVANRPEEAEVAPQFQKVDEGVNQIAVLQKGEEGLQDPDQRVMIEIGMFIENQTNDSILYYYLFKLI